MRFPIDRSSAILPQRFRNAGPPIEGQGLDHPQEDARPLYGGDNGFVVPLFENDVSNRTRRGA